MKVFKNEQFDEERALYGLDGIQVLECKFDGPADGESAMKEAKNIEVRDSYFNLRYPFWHNDNVVVRDCKLTELCRAAFWYTNDVKISDTKMYGIKALRECKNIEIRDCDIKSPEFGWDNENISMRDSHCDAEYFMMRSKNLSFDNVYMTGKYSFQYIEDSTFTNCNFDTKDAFWHAKNITVKDCVVKGEYLAWYCENVTFENCTIEGTQPLCYCKNLKLINCKMINCDLSFEKSDVNADVTTEVDSIKNPKSGVIRVPSVKKIIMDAPEAKGEIIVE